jgi:hypothetical protein
MSLGEDYRRYKQRVLMPIAGSLGNSYKTAA